MLLFMLMVFTNALAGDPISFSSQYTNQEDSCLWGEQITGIEPRGDDYRVCRGLNGYEVYEYYTAYGSPIKILQNDSIGYKLHLLPLKECVMCVYGKMLEWRFADGEPFAVICRIKCYSHPDSGEDESEHAEYLIVRGLQGYDIEEEDIDVRKTPRANEAARKYADGAYRY